MSADLLAEFDSFYQAPQKNQSNTAPASNDLSLLSDTEGNLPAGSGANVSQWKTPAAKPNNDMWGELTGFPSVTNKQQPKSAQDDTWGSFEGGFGQIQVPAQKPNYGGFTRDIQRTADQDKPGILRRPTLDLFSGNANDSSSYSDYKPSKPAITTAPLPPRPVPVTKSSYGEILFDAADEMDQAEPEDDDDFGDFETGASVPLPQPPPSHSLTGMFGTTTLEPKTTKRPADLLSTSTTLEGGNLPYPQAPKSPSFQERNPFTELGIATKHVSTVKKVETSNSASPITAWPTYEPKVPKAEPYIDSLVPDNADEEWGDFADLPPDSPAVHSTKAVSGIEADAWAWDTADQVTDPTPAAAQVDAPPPTNIPPPSVILAIFPVLFDLPQSTLFKAVASQPFSLKTRIISDPSTIDFLRGYLHIATVAARIVAGRKLRWKRDNLLSQAMKIGPSAAGGKGGMKLAGVDKTEITREDREAADVVRVWKDHLGRLRSAIAVANSSMQDVSAHLAIPDISDNMYVKTQKGGLAAPKPCIICGLKREERINKVDVQVEDSFGEWWVEHWGHRACRNFWLEHEPKLKNR
jgi:hypothetical protein